MVSDLSWNFSHQPQRIRALQGNFGITEENMSVATSSHVHIAC